MPMHFHLLIIFSWQKCPSGWTCGNKTNHWVEDNVFNLYRTGQCDGNIEKQQNQYCQKQKAHMNISEADVILQSLCSPMRLHMLLCTLSPGHGRHVKKLQQSSFSVGDHESNRTSAKKKQIEQPKNGQTNEDLTNCLSLCCCHRKSSTLIIFTQQAYQWVMNHLLTKWLVLLLNYYYYYLGWSNRTGRWPAPV